MKKLSKGLSHWLSDRRAQHRLPALGERELDVLKILWRHPELSAQQVLDRCDDTRIGLSTMQSTLERLHRKELLTRRKTGRAYLYTASLSQRSLISQLLEDIVEHISDGDVSPMVSSFMDYMGDDNDPENPRD